MIVSCTFYTSTKRLYTYIFLCLQHKHEVTIEGVLSVEPSFASPNLSLIDVHQDALKSEENYGAVYV